MYGLFCLLKVNEFCLNAWWKYDETISLDYCYLFKSNLLITMLLVTIVTKVTTMMISKHDQCPNILVGVLYVTMYYIWPRDIENRSAI